MEGYGAKVPRVRFVALGCALVNKLTILCVLVLVLLTLGCEDDETTSLPDADLTGRWVLTADGSNPPTTLACSGGHSGLVNTPLCSPFDLVFELDGAGYVGASSQAFCGAEFSALVAVNGNDLVGEIVGDDGDDVFRFTFTGTVSGSTAIIDPANFSVDGLSGNCTTTGFYRAAD